MTSHLCWRLLFCACLGLSLSTPGGARGHSGVPEPRSLEALPGGGWTMASNAGIVTSERPTELVCEEAFEGGDGWRLAALGPSEWVVFGRGDIRRTEDGCSFSLVAPLWGRPTDVAAQPDAGAVAFLRNGSTDTGLWLSTDRGLRFESLAVDLAPDRWTGVRFVDAETMLVSGYTESEAEYGASSMLLVSLTGVASRLSLPADITFPYLLDQRGDGVLWIGMRGETFVVFWGSLDEPARASLTVEQWPYNGRLSGDGQTAWLTGLHAGSGVDEASIEGDTLSLQAITTSTSSLCLELIDGAPLFCSKHTVDGFDLFGIDADGVMEGVYDLRDLEGLRVSCSADSDVGRHCPEPWALTQPFLSPMPGGDVIDVLDEPIADLVGGEDTRSTPDAAVTEATSPPPKSGDEGGCSQRPSHQSRVPWGLGVLLLAALAWGRLVRRLA